MSQTKRVLIADDLSPRALEIFTRRGIEAEVRQGLKGAELAAALTHYEGLAVRSATKGTAEVGAQAGSRLRVIGRAGIGVDNIDVTAATARGIAVMNTPFGNSITTAEHAIAMMFALARQLPLANASTHAGKWEKSRFMGMELTGKTLGVIGCGNIGSIVAERALGLKMKVVAFDPFLSEARARDLGVEKLELNALLARADIITLHTPMTEQTRGILNAERLGLCRAGVLIINCARGGLVVEEDLKAALDCGQVGGAALDVFAEEPAKNNPLFGMENVVCTPHLGASTNEAQENVALQVAEQISDFLLDGAVSNALNMPSVTAEEAPRLQPYMKLAELVGSFAGQIVTGGLKSVSLDYAGQVALLNVKPLSSVALMGLLQPQLDSVNMVNAGVMAASRNIQLSESRQEQAENYQNILRVRVEADSADGGQHAIAGTVIAGNKLRIISIDNVAIEAELTPTMLLVRNQDRPGFIGRLGTALGEAGVNIATFNLGRLGPGQDAIALLSVDQEVSPDLLKSIAAIDGVVLVKLLRFASLLVAQQRPAAKAA